MNAKQIITVEKNNSLSTRTIETNINAKKLCVMTAVQFDRYNRC